MTNAGSALRRYSLTGVTKRDGERRATGAGAGKGVGEGREGSIVCAGSVISHST